MAGGTWSPTSKPVLPGLYSRFEAAGLASIQPGNRGVMAVVGTAGWGVENTFVSIRRESDIVKQFGPDLGGDLHKNLHLALMGGPREIRAYRITGGSSVPASVKLKDTTEVTAADALTLTAKSNGEAGNSFAVTTAVPEGQTANGTLTLFWNDVAVKSWTYTIAGTDPLGALAAAINADPDNVWVDATKLAGSNGILAIVAKSPFSAGSNGGAITSISGYLDTVELGADIDAFTIGSLGSTVATAVSDAVTMTNRVRGEGRYVIFVTGDDTASDLAIAKGLAASIDHEGVVVVANGGKINDTAYTPAETANYLAAVMVKQDLSESLTYHVTPFTDVAKRYTKGDREIAVQSGCLVLINDGRSVKVEKGINSLITLRTGQNRSWKKIRTIRIMDAWSTDIQLTAEEAYIGKIINDTNGRMALLGAVQAYMRVQVKGRLAEDSEQFPMTIRLDPEYYGASATLIPEPDEVYVQIGVRITDTVDYCFLTVKAQ